MLCPRHLGKTAGATVSTDQGRPGCVLLKYLGGMAGAGTGWCPELTEAVGQPGPPAPAPVHVIKEKKCKLWCLQPLQPGKSSSSFLIFGGGGGAVLGHGSLPCCVFVSLAVLYLCAVSLAFVVQKPSSQPSVLLQEDCSLSKCRFGVSMEEVS